MQFLPSHFEKRNVLKLPILILLLIPNLTWASKPYNTEFTYSKSVSAAIKQEFISSLLGNFSGNQKQQLQHYFNGIDIYDIFSEEITKLGWNPHDYAVAHAINLIVHYQLYHDQETTRAQEAIILNYFRDMFQNPQMQAMLKELRDQDVQAMAEAEYWHAYSMIVYKAEMQSGKGGYRKSALKERAAAYFNQHDIDIAKFKIESLGGNKQVAKDTSSKAKQQKPKASVFKPQPEATQISSVKRKQMPMESKLNMNKVHGVMCGYKSGNSVSQGYFYEDYIYLLFNDGWAYERLEQPLSQFDRDKSKREEPQKWVRWRKRGDKYQLKGDEGWKETYLFKGIEAHEDMRLHRSAAKFRFYNSGGVMGGGTSFTSRYIFKREGRFEVSSSSLTTSGSLAIVPSSTYRYSDGSGSSSGTSSPYVVSSRRNTDGADRRGIYVIDGYEIELHFDNGTVGRQLFVLCDDDRKTTFIGKQGMDFEESALAEDLFNSKECKLVIDENDISHHRPKTLHHGGDYLVFISDSYALEGKTPLEKFRELLMAEQRFLGKAKHQKVAGEYGGGTSLLSMTYEDYLGRSYQAINNVGYVGKKRERMRFIRFLDSPGKQSGGTEVFPNQAEWVNKIIRKVFSS